MDSLVTTTVPLLFTLLELVILTALALSLLTGLLLLLAPHRLQQGNHPLTRWRSTRRALRPLETPIGIERSVYRHHRLVGLAIMTGSAFVLFSLMFSWSTAANAAALPGNWSPTLRQWLMEHATLLLWLGNVPALFIGAVVYFRPSLMRGTEQTANRWLSTRRMLKPLDSPHYGLQSVILNHPRLSGALITLATLYILASVLLFRP